MSEEGNIEEIPLHLILTKQTMVRKKRLETFRKFIQDGHGPKISPVRLFELKIEGFDGYELLDGNHRCRAFQEEHFMTVMGKIIPRNGIDVQGTLRSIESLNISEKVTDSDIKDEEWISKHYKGPKHFGSIWEESN